MACRNLSNDEIRDKLISCGFSCGPVTDSTRNVYLKKLGNLKESKESKSEVDPEHYSDDQLRAALKIYNVIVGPINSGTIRDVYIKKLKDLLSKEPNKNQEPMDVEMNFTPFASDEEDL